MLTAGAGQMVLWHTPISIVALIGLYFTYQVFANTVSDTMPITNYTFAIVIALSSVSFGYARCAGDEDVKGRAQYCGERFLHSSLLFLVASVVKYFLIQDQVQAGYSNFKIIEIIVALISLLPGVLFLGSLVNAIAALRDLNALLYERKKPGQELSKFF
jgi:hypothetical protein